MLKPLVFVIILGAAIGFALPGSRQAAPAAAEAEAEVPAGGKTRSSVAAPAPVPVETRVERSGNGHFYVHATVNGELVRFVVDTGATGVALTIDDARRAGVDVSEGSFDVIGTGASGAVRGQLVRLDNITLDGKEATNVRGAVLEGLEVSLLGQSYLSRLRSVEMAGDTMVLR
jgi:aspartyl protease family protein